MAIVVPFILAAAEVGTMASVLTTVAFAVTGISDKINKAAESVFGKDLVRVANIAGAAYGAFNGGFSIGDSTANIGYGELAADGMTDMAAVEAANAADAALQTGEIAQVASGAANVGYSDFTNTADMDAVQSAISGDTANVVDKIAGTPTSTVDLMSAREPMFPSAPDTQIAQTSGAAGNSATAGNASGVQAAGGSANNVTNSAPGFFDNMLSGAKKMVTNKDGTISNGALQAGGNIIQGAFGGYSAAKAREQAQANYDAQVARQARLANLGTGAWKQTQ